MNIPSKTEIQALLRLSFFIAVLIFFTAIFYDFAVKIYYSNTNPFYQIIGCLLAIILMTLAILILLLVMPDIRKAISRMFGLEESEQQNPSDEK